MCGVACMSKASFTGLLSTVGLPGQDRAVQYTSTRSGNSVCPSGYLWALGSLLERSEMHVTVHDAAFRFLTASFSHSPC